MSHVTAVISEAGLAGIYQGIRGIIGLLLVLISSGAQPPASTRVQDHRYQHQNSCGGVYQHQENVLCDEDFWK